MTTQRARAERGTLSSFVATIAVALFIVFGLVVDGGAKAQAIRAAQDIAADAVRTAGQQVSTTSVMGGGPATLMGTQAVAAGNAVITSAGATGSVAVSGQQLSATVSVTRPTVFLGLIGIDTVTGTGTATANAYQGISSGGTP